MAGTDGEGGEGLSSIPRRVSQRIVRDLQHDLQGAKQKGVDRIPAAILFALEKWLGFWTALIGSAMFVGGLGMGLVAVAEWASTVSVLANTVPWAIGHVWTLGLLTVLTWGVMLFALLFVSVVRLALWVRNITTTVWDQHTPPFPEESATTDTDSQPWPATEDDLDTARNRMWDFLGKGSITFVVVVFVLFLAEAVASSTLYALLSSEYISAVAGSINAGIGLFDFAGMVDVIAPGTSQQQLVLFILIFAPAGAVMAIGIRNFLFLAESQIREHFETVREDGPLGWAGLYLFVLLTWSTGAAIQLLNYWV